MPSPCLIVCATPHESSQMWEEGDMEHPHERKRLTTALHVKQAREHRWCHQWMPQFLVGPTRSALAECVQCIRTWHEWRVRIETALWLSPLPCPIVGRSSSPPTCGSRPHDPRTPPSPFHAVMHTMRRPWPTFLQT